ncbi:MAG: RrF2 family transcriptional regulator [Phycisphaerae bacterium]
MLSLTRKCDYALVAMAELARNGRRTISARGLAAEVGIRVPVLTNVLHRLQRHGLVTSRKGARGGYSLSRPPTMITLADVIEAIEGDVRLTPCCDGSGSIDAGAVVDASASRSFVQVSNGSHENGNGNGNGDASSCGTESDGGECELLAGCKIREPMQRVHRGLMTYFASVSVADLAFDSGLVQIEIAGNDCAVNDCADNVDQLCD